MDISKFLSKAIGLYLVILSIVMLANMPQFIHSVITLINNAPLMFVAGFCTFIIGILMVVSHNLWQWNWRLIITLFAWMILLKGISLLLYPQFIDKAAALFVQNMNIAYAAAVFNVALGLMFCYFGWSHNTRSQK